jgi:hypothetical protein
MLELEELKLSFSVKGTQCEHRRPGGMNTRVDEESTSKSYHGSH